MKRWYYGGCIYDVWNVEFDLVDQKYCVNLSELKLINYWRRDSGTIAVGKTDAQILIGNTAHIDKLKSDKYSVEQICNELYNNSISYIDYAIRKRNTALVEIMMNGNMSIIYDRIEDKAHALSTLMIPNDTGDHINLFDAY